MIPAADDAGGVEISPPTTDVPVLDVVVPDVVVADPTVPDATVLDVVAETSLVGAPTGEPLPHLPEAVCATDMSVDGLTAFFDARQPLIGADYQRAYPLPSGRVLWLFQDAFLPTSHGYELVHNAGLLQSGACFQLLRSGSAEWPQPYLFGEETVPFARWFWPLGGDVGSDGNLHVFVVEMVEHGGGFLRDTEPVATWLVTIDTDDLTVLDRQPAPNSSAALFGWSVVSAGEYTYLYAHCYRQFGYDPLWFAPEVLAHDHGCTADVRVARIPRGEFTATPEYWDGVGWVADPSVAVPVIPTEGRDVNPTQVALIDGRFVAITKIDDWWGRCIVVDVAPEAQGPWTTVGEIPVENECSNCNTYFASIVPYGADDDSFVVALSCNTFSVVHDHDHYTPTFLRVPIPSDPVADALVGVAGGDRAAPR
jgi:hypothetical protein